MLLPGELEWREERRRRADGIPLYDEDWTALVQGLARAGLPAEELAGQIRARSRARVLTRSRPAAV